MSINNFIPTIWSGQILRRLKITLAYASPFVVNHDHEGEIQDYGNTVKIHGISDPTISTYTKNVVMAEPEVLNDFEVELLIDGADKFNFKVDDIDQKQTQPKVVAEAMDRAAYGLALKADQYMAAKLVAAGEAGTDFSGETMPALIGTTAAPKVVGLTDQTGHQAAYEYLVDLGVALDNQKIPRTRDRYVIVPPWFVGELSKDIRFVGYSGAAGNTVLTDGFAGDAAANGLAGRAAGFNVISSLDVPTGSGAGGAYASVVAGVPSAASFANQIVKTEALRHPNQFADVLRGLHVYGGAVTSPERIVLSHLQQASPDS